MIAAEQVREEIDVAICLLGDLAIQVTRENEEPGRKHVLIVDVLRSLIYARERVVSTMSGEG